jgi:hypothetical protein
LTGGRGTALFFVAGKLSNGARAVGERVEQGIAPAGGKKRRSLLVYGFVGLGEEANVLPWRRGGKFPNGDEEIDLVLALTFLEREMMKQGEFFVGVFLCESPITHTGPPLRGAELVCEEARRDTRILGCAVGQVNARRSADFLSL